MFVLTNPNTQMILKGNKLTLRPYRYGDEESLSVAANNIKVFNNVRDLFPHPYTLARAKEWVHFQISTDSQQGTSFAIDVAGKVVGSIAIVPQTDILRVNAEIGYWLGEDYWGKGIITEAVRIMVGYTFAEFAEINRIFAGVLAHNVASMRVLEKNGFRLEAILKEAAIKNSIIEDDYLYALLRKEAVQMQHLWDK